MLIEGDQFIDIRGIVKFNNRIDLNEIRRIYSIHNQSTSIIRGWQGHAVEKRWFCCVKGSFKISIIEVDNFREPNRDLPKEHFVLNDYSLDFLTLMPGYVTSLQSLQEDSILLVMSNNLLGEVNDDFKYPLDYFN